jgi:hypothetical protein
MCSLLCTVNINRTEGLKTTFIIEFGGAAGKARENAIYTECKKIARYLTGSSQEANGKLTGRETKCEHAFGGVSGEKNRPIY